MHGTRVCTSTGETLNGGREGNSLTLENSRCTYHDEQGIGGAIVRGAEGHASLYEIINKFSFAFTERKTYIR